MPLLCAVPVCVTGLRQPSDDPLLQPPFSRILADPGVTTEFGRKRAVRAAIFIGRALPHQTSLWIQTMQHQNRFLEFETEHLESRQMLAGDVSVVARHGDVIVTGDHADNAIRIQDALGGRIRVEGRFGTRINGVTNGSSYLTLTDDLRINLKHGNNQLGLGGDFTAGLHIPDDVSVRTGHGNDYIVTNNLVVNDDLVIHSGSGSDLIAGYSSSTYFTVGDDVKVASRGRTAIAVDWSVSDDMKISTGHGDDHVQFTGSVFGKLSVTTRGGSDTVELMDAYVIGNMSIATHGGNDTFQFHGQGSYAAGDIRLSMGHGYDVVSITAALSNTTEIRTSGVEVG